MYLSIFMKISFEQVDMKCRTKIVKRARTVPKNHFTNKTKTALVTANGLLKIINLKNLQYGTIRAV